MTESETLDILDHVPVGRDNAASAKTIWRQVDCWAETSISEHLMRLCIAGHIKRRQEPFGNRFRWLYWREAERPRLMPAGECAYCDANRGESMMPSHTASPRCESGARPHCTCDVCF